MGKPEKTRNGRRWTEARFNSFVKGALRSARWPPKYRCIQKAYVEDGINPKTGRRCKLHRCQGCGQTFPKNQIRADHIEPVVPVTGFTNWDDVINRLFVEADGFQALCVECHKSKTKEENANRKRHEKLAKELAREAG